MPEGGTPPVAAKPRFFTRRSTLIIILVILVLGAGAAGYFVFRPDAGSDRTGDTINTNTGETLVRRAIDGVYDVSEYEQLPVVGVMIENLASIRPQAGLDEAKIVYEALAEGGITRFLALFTMTGPIESIGPVRSARPYYVDWVKEYDALYAHAGGSPQAMSDIQAKGIFNLDQFYNAQYYVRENLPRAREHNLFTSSELLTYALRDKEAESSSFSVWEFKNDASIGERPVDVAPITINFSSASYQVVYEYDSATNTYGRFQGETPHTVMGSGAQISPKNVLVQYVESGLADAQRLTMETVGSGDALLFRDGQVIEGTWSKSSTNDRTEFLDAAGDPMVFNAGQTWIEVVPTDRDVTYLSAT